MLGKMQEYCYNQNKKLINPQFHTSTFKFLCLSNHSLLSTLAQIGFVWFFFFSPSPSPSSLFPLLNSQSLDLNQSTISGYLATAGNHLIQESYQVVFSMNNKIRSIEVGILTPAGQVPVWCLLISGRSQDRPVNGDTWPVKTMGPQYEAYWLEFEVWKW